MLSLVSVAASLAVVINGPVAVQHSVSVNRAGPVAMMAKKEEEKKPWSLAAFLNGPGDKFQGGRATALLAPLRTPGDKWVSDWDPTKLAKEYDTRAETKGGKKKLPVTFPGRAMAKKK